MLEFLTDELRSALENVNLNFVYELRIRANKPVVLSYGGRYTFLGKRGITPHRESALVSCYADIETIIYRACQYSLYSVTEQLRQGFLTGAGGERIGLAGIFVYEDGETFTVKEVTSLNIRVPHEVKGCGAKIFDLCFADGVKSALLLSPPGRGKTTILRDLTRLISEKNLLNVLINDERNELSASYRDFSLDTGAFSDVIRYSKKSDAFTAAVRAMRPDLIVTDELVTKEEIAAVAACIRSGVGVLASAHCKDAEGLKSSPVLSSGWKDRLFSYYVFLRSEGVGEIASVYDADLQAVPLC